MDREYTYTRVNYHKTLYSLILAILKEFGAIYVSLFLIGAIFVKAHTKEAMNASLVRRAFDVQLVNDQELSKLIGSDKGSKSHEELISETLQRQLIAR